MKTPAFLLAILATAVTAAPPRAGIFPIVECPDDNPYPQVMPLPSVGGQDLEANQYVVCFKGKPFVFTCSEGLFFNWSTMSCDFPYERRSQDPPVGGSESNGPPSEGDLDLDHLIPAGPIPVPVSPQLPIPIRSRHNVGGNVQQPLPPYPETKPDPSVISPIPVRPLPARPLPPHRPIPYY